MTAAIIGISSGLLIILLFEILKRFDKKIIYGLILCAIGFLYVGYVWMNLQALVINSIQAILFLFIAYYGIKKILITWQPAISCMGPGIWLTIYFKIQT